MAAQHAGCRLHIAQYADDRAQMEQQADATPRRRHAPMHIQSDKAQTSVKLGREGVGAREYDQNTKFRPNRKQSKDTTSCGGGKTSLTVRGMCF